LIVLDASAAIDLLLQIHPNATSIGTRLRRGGESLHVPAVFDVEVLDACRRYGLGKVLTAPRARQALDDLADLRIARYSYAPLLDRMWELRTTLSAFDAAYVALAEVLDAPLVTTDRRLGRAPGHKAKVEVIP
jgi:predicted nucleic acid-binding protein